MNITQKGAMLLVTLGLISGMVGTVAIQIHAAASTIPTTTQSVTAANPAPSGASQGHSPLGGDGNITAINGTTITMQEEADEGGASYTVDASKAAVVSNGINAGLSTLKVGDKIFVQGTVSGTNVSATSISAGRPEGRGPKPGEQSGSDTN